MPTKPKPARQPPTTAPSIRDRVIDFRRVPASALVPNPRNWRLHNDAQRRMFRDMLDRIGFAGAELVRALPDGRLMLIDGHMRQEELGDAPLPVLVTDLDEREADALLASFDPIARLAGTDTDAANALIESLGAAGYDAAADLLAAVAANDQTAALLESLADGMLGAGDGDGHEVDDPGGGGDDFDTTPDESGPTRVQSSDLWQLGAHRLLCGDSTRREDVARLMGDTEPFQCLWTDPPYGVNHSGGSKDPRSRTYRSGDKLQNDALPEPLVERMLTTALTLAAEYGTAGATAYVAAPPGPLHRRFIDAMNTSGFEYRHDLVWVKDTFVFGRSDYHYRHEPILYGWLGNGAHYFTGDRTQDSIFEVPRPKRSEEHPTMKPILLVAQMVKNSSCDGDGVYDPFLGSGTTLIACERLSRRCYGIEIDPRYCDVILRRWEAETGREAVLVERITDEQEPEATEAVV